ncbi:MAG: class I SAM-dependent methyltransferase [Xanthomonadales bacterium PRO7]|jgi:SAM-dependent methyltransferase|nr:class I SAM-dependent methyltransferase [Xanthomonadales bacterium PRO7]HMM57439.1 class I SAM-dependent methyltransferase [Rudaea sp.]
MSGGALEFTGERFTPECVREIRYEHFARYAFALGLARGKRVLDAACGEGYGSAMLAGSAASVLGVDIAEDAIAHARSRYGTQANLRFDRGDCTALDVAPGSFDLVVSFETLEHVAAQQQLIAGFARALADDGVLVVSSPDKRTYSDISGFRNEFHVRELYRDELLALLAPHFPQVRLYGQKLLFQSAIWNLDAEPRTVAATTLDESAPTPLAGLDYAPLYFIAVCSRRALPEFPDASLFGDREESVYAHYNGEVRRNMAAGGRIAELEAEVARLRGELDQLKPQR